MDLPVTFRAYLFICRFVRAVTVNAERKEKEKKKEISGWAGSGALYNGRLLNFFIINKNTDKTQSKEFWRKCMSKVFIRKKSNPSNMLLITLRDICHPNQKKFEMLLLSDGTTGITKV